jgi:phosphate transport system ATP-binding protein
MVTKISVRGLDYAYGSQSALKNVTVDVPANSITVLFGPSRAGKSTLLRCLNRLNDLIEDEPVTLRGQILLDDQDVYAPGVNATELRRRVGMVFALPLPLPMTIRENVTYGLRMRGERESARLDQLTQRSLTEAAIWDEVKDRLDHPAMALSGGQQQRLCLARTLALEPEVILLDNPTSGLDPLSTAKVEATLRRLRETYTVILVPHSVQQAARMADLAIFLLNGEVIETAPGAQLFTRPREKRTEDYVTGRFG